MRVVSSNLITRFFFNEKVCDMTTKSEEKNSFENDLVSLTVHRKPHCIVEYEVKASKAVCTEAHKKAAKSVGKDVLVPQIYLRYL